MFRALKLLPLTILLAAGSAAAAPQTAQAFLDAIYSHYHGSDDKTAKGIMFDKPSDYKRYFTAETAKLIGDDEAVAAKHGDVPTLDGDPFVDAQDWDVTNIAIRIDSQDAKSAKATVRFLNFKKPYVLHYMLTNTPDGWRIADIVWPGNQGTLRGLYKKTK